MRKANPEEFVPDNEGNRNPGIKLEMSHVDAYLAAFYLINLTAWMVIRKLAMNVSASGLIWGFFLSVFSSLLFWLFIHGMIEWFRKKHSGKVIFLFLYFLIALVIGYLLLWTSWIS